MGDSKPSPDPETTAEEAVPRSGHSAMMGGIAISNIVSCAVRSCWRAALGCAFSFALAGCRPRGTGVSPAASRASSIADLASAANAGGEREHLLFNGAGAVVDQRIAHKFSTTETSQVLHAVFAKYLTDFSQCPDEDLTLEEARDVGAVVPSITSRIEGAFTAPNAQERVYLIAVGECGASHANSYGTRVLVLYRGAALVATIPVEEVAIVRALDVDGDGRVELALESGWTHMGMSESSLTLYQVGHDSLRLIQTFERVFESHCGTGEPQSTESHSIITVRSDGRGAPDFTVTRKTRPCD